MNHSLMNIARIAFKTLVGAQLPKASKRRRATVDFSATEQLELRKLLTATLSDLSLTQVTGTTYAVLSGAVQDEWGAAGVRVNFGGALAGSSITADDDGTFSYMFDDSTTSGDVTAQADSWDGTTSNILTISLAMPA